MKAALVLHGDPPSREDLGLLRDCDEVVATDGAALHLLKEGVVPDVVVGDMDSLGAEGLALARKAGAHIQEHPRRKDLTDGELALQAVLDFAPREVLILGAHGGRSAMFLANLKLLRRCHDRGIEARIVGRGEVLRFLTAGQAMVLRGSAGATLNLLAVDGDARVSIAGTAYDAQDTRLLARMARGVSNPIVAAEARVEVHEGAVLAIVEAQTVAGR